MGWNSGVENWMERWVQLTCVTGTVQGCASYYVSRALTSQQSCMSKSSVATFLSLQYHGVSDGQNLGSLETKLLATKVVRPSSDRGSRCTDADQSEMTEIKYQYL